VNTAERMDYGADPIFLAITESALDAIITIDQQGIVQQFNSAAEGIFDYSAKEAIGRSLADLIVPPEMREMHQKGLERTAESGEKRLIGKRTEMEAINRLGIRIPVELTLTKVNTDEGALYISHIRDLTQHKLAEKKYEQQQKALLISEKKNALSSFIAGIAHEINNPLSIINAQLEFLKRENFNEPIFKRLMKIENSVKRCAKTVDAFSSILNQKTLQYEYMQLHKLVDDAISLARESIDIPSVTIDNKVPIEISEFYCDSKKSIQALTNIITNAIEALEKMDKGCIQVTTEEDSDKKAIELTIINNGPSIRSNDLIRIFDPFYTTKDVGEGEGLGLSISKAIIEAHGGEIMSESTPENGVSFTIKLPIGDTSIQ